MFLVKYHHIRKQIELNLYPSIRQEIFSNDCYYIFFNSLFSWNEINSLVNLCNSKLSALKIEIILVLILTKPVYFSYLIYIWKRFFLFISMLLLVCCEIAHPVFLYEYILHDKYLSKRSFPFEIVLKESSQK